MIEFTHTNIMNFDGAIRGMRNSWESHHKSDSYWEEVVAPVESYGREFVIGREDYRLAFQLANTGGSHAKFLRQIFVCVDINAPLYWWKEMDQYKFIVTNSESTMHTIQRKPMTECLYSIDVPEYYNDFHKNILGMMETLRNEFLKTKDRSMWKYLIQLLPSGWMQKRTTTMNYATIRGAYHDRKGHRLSEWQDFREWAESLPYSEFIIGVKSNG